MRPAGGPETTAGCGCDFHLHSLVSDGRLPPAEVVRLAHAHGVRVMALTDHDATDGVAEAQAAGETLGVRVVPGVELSTDLPGASIHVLGLFLDHTSGDFQAAVARFREARVTRAEQMVAALVAHGAPVSVARVFELAGEGSVGRPHVARALLEAGHVASMQEAFDRFLAFGKPAYFDGYRLEPAEAVRLIHATGGLAIWAHPFEADGADWHQFLPALLEAGIDGLEAYYGKEYALGWQEQLLDACAAHDLVPSVGSDYHGFKELDRLPGTVPAPAEVLERLESRLARLRAA